MANNIHPIEPSFGTRASSTSRTPNVNTDHDFHFRAARVNHNHVPNININDADQMLSTSSAVGGGKIHHHHHHDKKVRKPKYAFQTRSQVDILDDGYRWRKYGQKKVKNNDFPRSYYRCTYQGCDVKKQVQRLSRDESVVVTTYEGIHTHPVEKPTDNFEEILSQMQIYPLSLNVNV